MVATSYPRDETDWQGVFIRNLAAALAASPDVQLDLWAPNGPRAAGINYACSAADTEWLDRIANRGGIAHLLRTSPARGGASSITLLRRLYASYRRAVPRTDVFHINWMQNALSLAGLSTPALVSVLGTDFKLLKLPGMTQMLRAVLGGRKAVLAPNSDWMVEPLRRSFGDTCEVQAVPFGIDDSWYNVRRAVETPSRWLVVSRVTRDKMGPLFEWGDSLFRSAARELHLVGPNQEKLAIPPWVKFHGPLPPAKLCAEFFPRATGLLTLSEHSEGRPQVILEAMAAGLPLVASPLSAHCELVEGGRSGRIVASKDELRAALEALEADDANAMASRNAVRYARREYGTWHDCAGRYRALYAKLCV